MFFCRQPPQISTNICIACSNAVNWIDPPADPGCSWPPLSWMWSFLTTPSACICHVYPREVQNVIWEYTRIQSTKQGFPFARLECPKGTPSRFAWLVACPAHPCPIPCPASTSLHAHYLVISIGGYERREDTIGSCLGANFFGAGRASRLGTYHDFRTSSPEVIQGGLEGHLEYQTLRENFENEEK